MSFCMWCGASAKRANFRDICTGGADESSHPVTRLWGRAGRTGDVAFVARRVESCTKSLPQSANWIGVCVPRGCTVRALMKCDHNCGSLVACDVSRNGQQREGWQYGGKLELLHAHRCRGRRKQAAHSTAEWKKTREKVAKHTLPFKSFSILWYMAKWNRITNAAFRRDTCSCEYSWSQRGFARQLAGNYEYSTHIHICLCLIWLLTVKKTWQALQKQAANCKLKGSNLVALIV